MWKIFFEYMDKSKITLTGKGSDISLRLAMKYDNLYNREAVRAEYQRYPKNKYAAIPDWAEATDEFEKPTPLDAEVRQWKLAVILPCRYGPRKRSMTELLFCMLRSGH